MIAYMDDLLIASDTEKDHLQRLSQLFQWLCSYNVHNPDKCILGQTSIMFLGHHIDSSGIWQLPSKVDAIQCISTPMSLHQLWNFIRIVNFYHLFIPNCAQELFPLTQHLQLQRKTNLLLTLSSKALLLS